jgi:hypothetical protein
MADGRDAYDGLAERLSDLPRDVLDQIARRVLFCMFQREELAAILRDRGVLGDLAKFRAWVEAESDTFVEVLAKMDEMGM